MLFWLILASFPVLAVSAVVPYAIFATGTAALIFSVLLAINLRSFGAWVWVGISAFILVFYGGFALLPLFILYLRAKKVLRGCGVGFDLMGAKQSDLDRFKS